MNKKNIVIEMIIYILIFLLILYLLISNCKKEGFSMNTIEDISHLYDEMFYIIPFYEELIYSIKDYLYPHSQSLCINSKNGHIVKLLSSHSKTSGLESCSHLKKCSQDKYNDLSFYNGSWSNRNLFLPEQFNHIIVPINEIHTIDNIELFLENCNYWLKRNGRLFVSFTNVSTFDIKSLENKNNSYSFNSQYKFHHNLENNLYSQELYFKNKKIYRNVQPLHNNELTIFINQCKLEQFKLIEKKEKENYTILIFEKKNTTNLPTVFTNHYKII